MFGIIKRFCLDQFIKLKKVYGLLKTNKYMNSQSVHTSLLRSNNCKTIKC